MCIYRKKKKVPFNYYVSIILDFLNHLFGNMHDSILTPSPIDTDLPNT